MQKIIILSMPRILRRFWGEMPGFDVNVSFLEKEEKAEIDEFRV